MTLFQPAVTIILPVYNVEPYLRQCLDSVVNQTERNIQIICVNDGSTDGSRAILQEYADGDSRIEIIDQENQGAGSARNAAYPFIKGKYTYFADPDDWLEHDLCEKAVRRIKETDADVVFFRCNRFCDANISERRVFDPHLPKIRYSSPQDKADLLQCSLEPWCKVWKSDFLIAHRILFCEGKRSCNDVVHHWHGIVLAKKMALLDETLYVYRMRPGSYQTIRDKSHSIAFKLMNDLEFLLKALGLFASYESDFRQFKLGFFHNRYLHVLSGLQQEFRALILANLTADDRKFYRTGKAGKDIARFYEIEIEGNPIAIIKEHVPNIVKSPERLLRHWVIRPLKAWLASRMNANKKTNDAEIISFPLQESDESSQRHVA